MNLRQGVALFGETAQYLFAGSLDSRFDRAGVFPLALGGRRGWLLVSSSQGIGGEWFVFVLSFAALAMSTSPTHAN